VVFVPKTARNLMMLFNSINVSYSIMLNVSVCQYQALNTCLKLKIDELIWSCNSSRNHTDKTTMNKINAEVSIAE